MKYKLFATDFDGTLVDETLKISEKNYNAIQEYIKLGGNFILSSGRASMSLEIFEKQLGIVGDNNFGISFNGAKVYNCKTREVIYSRNLENNHGQRIIDVLIEEEIPVIMYSDEEELFIQHPNDARIKEYLSHGLLDHKEIKDIKSYEKDFTKLVIADTRESLERVLDIINKINDNDFNVFSLPYLLEFTNIEATKGDALRFLTNHMNIPIKSTIACGDNLNDVQMIEVAGLGVAMKNAIDEVKEVAQYITKNNASESAIAEVIYKVCFINQKAFANVI